jgi:transcriptional regulator with PAS, ATPase and Fis domain
VIGRVAEGGIEFPRDSRVSRTHATLFVEAGRDWVHLVDSSRNGSFVNGQEVKEAELRDGDLVRVGDSFVLLRRLAEVEDLELAGLTGQATAMRALRSTIALVAPTETTVLVQGESGTGKEVVARLVHQLSGRRGELVAVNASTIPESLAESQLFGHTGGAFTGATTAHPGFFRMADRGTLFLDEIGELPLSLQPKLLRVLEERTVRPLGATAPVPVDVRVIAATNRDLRDAVEAGTFRGDLYARLAEITLALPPLRERREDVLLILLGALPSPPPRLTPELVEALLLHDWPFNVRELIKVASELKVRGAKLSELDVTLLGDRLRRRGETSPEPEAKDDAPIPERAELEELLRRHKGNVTAIAKERKRSRKQIYRWLEQYGLDHSSFRD